MCEYCNGSKPLKIGITNDEGIAIHYGGGGMYLNAYGYDIFGNKSNGLSVKINYCPMCGSKINERTYKLEELSNSENPNKWIPVSKRLPEKNIACLVAVGEFNLTQMAVYSDLMGTIDHRIFYQGDYGCGSFEDITQYVKAWQPLPEPYKAERKQSD